MAGRPKKDIDPRQVELLASAFCTNEEIAAKLKCSPDTLTRRFAEQLSNGRNSAKCNLRALQWRSANKGSDKMLIWLGKQYLEQKDKVEHSGDEEKPVAVKILAGISMNDL